MEKRIEPCRMKAGMIKTGFGNPRKIKKEKLKELEDSIRTYGDFGVFLIDEHDNVIAGNQRLKAVLSLYGPDADVDCKRLVGYSKAELRSINIKDNTHAGEWDLDLLADWTADLNIDLGLKLNDTEKTQERKIDEMELIYYEKYDYVMIVCRDELSYNTLVRNLGIEEAKVLIGPKKRPTKARAIWFDDMKVDLVPKEQEKKAEGGSPELDAKASGKEGGA